MAVVLSAAAVVVACGARDGLFLEEDGPGGLGTGGSPGVGGTVGAGGTSNTGGGVSTGGGPGTGGFSGGGTSGFGGTGGFGGGTGGIGRSCGNGNVDPGEMCDGANFDGETCASVTMGGLPFGNLGCSPTCTFDTSRCIGGVGGGPGPGGGPGTGGFGAIGGQGGTGAFGGMGANGGTAGNGGMGAIGGGPQLCNPAFCPPIGFGSPCCLSPRGPCGVDFGFGCRPRPGGGDGGPP